MKKSNILAAGLTVIAACAFGATAYAAETGTMGNLTETSSKISSIDMEKNLGEAGKVLDGFYSGAKGKKEMSAAPVALEASNRTISQAEKEVCNAKPSKIVLSGKVPPLSAGTDRSDTPKKDLPIGSGLLAAGAVTLALAGKKKGYFSNYGEDAHTVWNYITGSDGSSGSGSSSSNSSGNSVSTHTVVNVDNSSGTVTTSTGTDTSCPSSSTACYGQSWVNSQLPHY